MKDSYQYLGIGIYSVPEAAKLTGVASNRIRRWVLGYRYRYDGQERKSAPILHSQLPALDDSIAIGFLDLIEVRFVNAFREYGVGWETIRLATEKAKELFDQDHPFACKIFKTDGRSIFAEIIQETGEKSLLDLVKNQYAFRQIISKELYKGIDFTPSGISSRWWPMGKRNSVVIDPARSFGKPVVNKEGVPTSILAKAVKTEESIQRVSSLYDVSVKSVKDAIEFERKLAA